ncbi:MAG TPA: hypothetical protein VFL15_10955 [Gammaproteobacteria bacterium]|nr:hypothetical protein [Gammaproteobacteria bacterium]
MAIALPWAAAHAADNSGNTQPDPFQNLKFRNLGPAVAGGRVSAVVGIPGNPHIYYVGAAAGGVWKSTDGGQHWESVLKDADTASIGDIALAPSNPNLVWVGTGEANVRNNVLSGGGVYFSPDAGHSWKFMGLKDAGQISRVIVDPHDSNTVFVGAIGNIWKPNAERGVFKTTDGGKTWKKVLFVNDQTGVASMVMDPNNPKVLYAAMWQVRRFPWTLDDGGPGSAIWRSTDGGDTWTKLTKDMPKGPLGRIALAVAPSDSNRVYALIEAKRGEGLLWRSDNMGDDWTRISDNYNLDVRPFYFSRMAVAPDNENRIYFLSFLMMRSDDGGKTATPIDRGVHVDHHAIWIDPKDPNRIIQGNDGGVYLTTTGGKSWRFLDSLPIEQFYMVAADSRTPYNLCGGLQDNSAWCGPSSTLADDVVSGADWFTVTGGDGEYAVPAPSNPNIIYSDSQDGAIGRYDLSTHRSTFTMPYVRGPGFINDTALADLKYRFNWTSPIAVSPTDENTVFLGANVVFKSTDGGIHWEPISGDLTRNDKSKQQLPGGPVNYDISGAENYDTLLSITLAPTDQKVIWTGSDDGLVHMTRDGGKHWENVTPSGAPKWERVYQIGVSPFDAGTAYVAFDGHMLGDDQPHVYATDNFGKSWRRIDEGLPDAAVNVVREDPDQRGLLILGNMTGLWYSRDSGKHWQQLKADFPVVPVYDLKFVHHDLVVATHGRGLFVLDDLRPLEQMDEQVRNETFHLFGASTGTQFITWNRGEGAEPAFTTPNAPHGVVVDYYLAKELKATASEKQDHESPVKIEVKDGNGNVVDTEYGSAKQGVNRFVWNMRYQGPTELDFEHHMGGGEGFGGNHGPLVLPGTYTVAVTVNGKTATAAARVVSDPNQKLSLTEMQYRTRQGLATRNQVSALHEMLNRLVAMQSSLSGFEQKAQSGDDKKQYAAVLGQAKALDKKLGALKDSVYNSEVQHDAIEDDIHYLQSLNDSLEYMMYAYMGDPQPYPPNVAETGTELAGKLDKVLAQFNSLLQTDVPAYNKAAYAAGAPTLMVGKPVSVKPVEM